MAAMEDVKGFEGHTPAPWIPGHLGREDHSCDCRYVLSEHYMGCIAVVSVRDESTSEFDYPSAAEAAANMRLIAAAPSLLHQVSVLKEALRFYADKATYANSIQTPGPDVSRIEIDGGERARKALGESR